MENDLIFGNETTDMATGHSSDDTQLAAAPAGAEAPFADALARPFDAAQVVVPEGQSVVREEVTPGEIVELPFPADSQFLARIADGNLAIKVGDVTVILQGYVEAAGQTPPVIEAANGQPLDIATILASTDPNIDIQTAAGPAAGPQGQGADNTGALFAQFGDAGGLGGFTGAGALDGTDGLGNGPVDQTGTLFRLFGDAALLANTAPTAFDENEKTDEDTAVNGKVTATDPEGDPLTYATVGGVPAGLTFNSDGTWTFDPSGKYDKLNVGDSDTVTFQYKANDGVNDSNVATVTIDITGVNDAPKFQSGFTKIEYSEDDKVAGQFLNWKFTDPDDAGQPTLAVDPSTLPPGVTYNAATGVISFNTQGKYDYLKEGEVATFNIKFTATDAHGGTTDKYFVLKIDGVNDAPVAVADIVLTNNGATTFDLPGWAERANDQDPDSPLHVTLASSSTVNFGMGSTPEHIKVIDIGPLGGTIDYQVTDDHFKSSSSTITITNQAGGNLNGGASGEIIIGSSGAETIHGNGGNDIIIGNKGGDELFGDAGDDTLVFAAGSKIHGGTDTVALAGGLAGADKHGDVLTIQDAKVDFSDHTSVANIDGIETISMAAKAGGEGAQSLTLGALSVQDLSNHTINPSVIQAGNVFTSSHDAVRIDGDAVDQLYLSISKDGGNWTATGATADGYTVYAHEATAGDATTADAYVMVHTGVTVHVNQDAP